MTSIPAKTSPSPHDGLVSNDEPGSDSHHISMKNPAAQDHITDEQKHSFPQGEPVLHGHTTLEHEDADRPALQDQEGDTEPNKRLSGARSTHAYHPFRAFGLDSQDSERDKVTEGDSRDAGTEFFVDPLRTSCQSADGKELEFAIDDEDDEDEEDGDAGSNPVKSKEPSTKRASHLRLDVKPPSPQPWEIVEPPTRFTAVRTQKMRGFQGMNGFDVSPRRPAIPKSSYYFGPPPSDAAFGTPPVGHIGIHYPREIIRIERDYTGGELTQFAPIYPLELEGRITPTHFLESINAINELLISAHSTRYSFIDNVLAIFTLQLSKLFWTSHYEKEMKRLEHLIEELNSALYNPVGLNILWPRDVAFLFLEIEYY